MPGGDNPLRSWLVFHGAQPGLGGNADELEGWTALQNREHTIIIIITNTIIIIIIIIIATSIVIIIIVITIMMGG